MRLVLDLNVLVSAVISSGPPGQLLDRWRQHGDIELVVCPRLLDELSEVLARPKLARLVSADQAAALRVLLHEGGKLVEDPGEVEPIVRDPDDGYLVALAVEHDVDALVSGDDDLQSLTKPPIPIWPPAEALRRLGAP